MRKLTVKNFSVIKEAELEFGKITVLIGPQASGKSLLCKLAYFLGFLVPDLAAEFSGTKRSWRSLLEAIDSNFRVRFPEYAWGSSSFSICYESGAYSMAVSRDTELIDQSLEISFSPEFEGIYAENQNWGGRDDPDNPNSNVIRQTFRALHSTFETHKLLGNTHLELSRFIPAGRSFFANLNNAFALFQNENLDPTLREFASYLDWDTTPTKRPSTPLVAAGIREMAESIQGGKIRVVEGTLRFVSPDGRELPLKVLSSGTQELVPLLMLLDQLVHSATIARTNGGLERIREHFLFVEEPEAHIFPSTQYQLVQLFAWLTAESTLNFSWAITTHSPYTLSAFNNLIEASNVVTANPEQKYEVAKLIPEQYWVKSSDFKAYCIHDGKLESIMDTETGLISGNYLDSVSDTIGGEFDELLRLGYVKA